ncbi:MAG: GNAT family N-acetyltransferase, partial [Oscillospiraceae bacterium]|nr:GNAT family N-acetyltransferase [Oscillospiraceae bacterium]
MTKNFYVGPAKKEDYGELMAMLDDVFFFDDAPSCARGFLPLLPKLYKKEYRPWERNLIVREGGVIRAAAGMYVLDCVIAGQPLRCGGIGNVAVARDSRRLGYMKLVMDAAMDAMRAEGCDFGALGGQRQRYAYWGFERTGVVLRAECSRSNLRHAFGKRKTRAFRPERLLPESKTVLREIQALTEAAPVHGIHAPEAFYDCLCSWDENPFALWDGERLAGCFLLDRFGKDVSTLMLHDAENDFEAAVHTLFDCLP